MAKSLFSSKELDLASKYLSLRLRFLVVEQEKMFLFPFIIISPKYLKHFSDLKIAKKKRYLKAFSKSAEWAEKQPSISFDSEYHHSSLPSMMGMKKYYHRYLASARKWP